MATKAKTAPKLAPVEEVTPVASWKKPNRPLIMPSGNVALCRRGSFQAFMKIGIIPNSLMTTVQDALNKGVSPQEEVAGVGMENIDDLLEMVDNITLFCMVDPKCHETPEDLDQKDDSLLYVDEVDDEDKMFIMQWATGGTDDVEQFRSEAGNSLATVRASKNLE